MPKFKKMKPSLKRAWVKALRSGSYRQTTGTLISHHDKHRPHYCCLGVLCRVAGGKFDNSGKAILPSGDVTAYGSLEFGALKYFNISESVESKLISMNDDHHLSFKKIADFIEKNL